MKLDTRSRIKEPVPLGATAFARLNDIHVFKSSHNSMGKNDEFQVVLKLFSANSGKVDFAGK